MARDDYRCAVAGSVDYSRPAPLNDDESQAPLHCAHILKRAVGIRSNETVRQTLIYFCTILIAEYQKDDNYDGPYRTKCGCTVIHSVITVNRRELAWPAVIQRGRA